MHTQYDYVGPIEIKEKATELYNAFSVSHANEFQSWAQQQNEWENDILTITFVVIGATNQSTGYCPKPECWKVAYAILTQLKEFQHKYLIQAFFLSLTHHSGLPNMALIPLES